MDKIVLDWFRLINSKGVGAKTFWYLINKFKSAEEALNYVENPFDLGAAEKILAKYKGEVLIALDPRFPKSLKKAEIYPPVLFCKGDLNLLNERKIAIIGARNASISGRAIATRFAVDLSQYFTIVSGLAAGIDASAHSGALLGAKKTIAVMPFGTENVYPQGNKNLCARIEKEGLIISDISPHRPPDQCMFRSRNRLLTLMSDAIIVVEAALKSGTILTCNIALDLGVEVLVVPGFPMDPRSKGGNSLIKNGAPLVEDYMDVIEALGFKEECNHFSPSGCNVSDNRSSHADYQKDKTAASEKLIAFLSAAPLSIDIIADNIDMNISDLFFAISDLELSGRIYKNSNNEIFLSPK